MRSSDWSSDVCSSDLQLNAGLTLNVNRTQIPNTDPNRAAFSSNGGNPALKPFKSTNIDLSVEQYFADGKGYVSLAGFYKDLNDRSEEHTSELQSLMRISYAVFCLKTKKTQLTIQHK